MSFASDVYPLGMCILEAVTREMPWKYRCTDRYINVFRSYWDPEAPGEARDLVWKMCCKNPYKRTSLAFVVHELERLAIQESANLNQFESETTTTGGCLINQDSDEIQKLWINVQSRMQKRDNDLYQEAFAELKTIRERLQYGSHSSTVFYQFYKVLRDFREVITVSREQARVLRLSATRATSSSIIAFRRRLQSLATALGESTDGTAEQERGVQWDKQRRKQIEIFVSEASRTYLLLEELKSQEERQLFLASLKAEIEHPSLEYTPGHLDVLKKAYEEIASKLDANDLSSLTPRWFIPWYELIIDEYDELGSGAGMFHRKRARPTSASDIYSLGMCIVEALRVVEAGEDHAKACLPWGFLDNFVAKYHVKQGLLPPRPLCTDEQWDLVQRMCAFKPSNRIKISTVKL